MTQTSCKRETRSKSHPGKKQAPVRVFSCKHSLNCWAPVSLSYICVQISILAHFPFPAKFKIGRIWDRLLAFIPYIGKICYGRQKVKSLIIWDFPNI